MKIRTPKFVRKMLCKHISKAVEKETGIRTDIEIQELTVDTNGKEYSVHMSETINVNKSDLKKFIKKTIKESKET